METIHCSRCDADVPLDLFTPSAQVKGYGWCKPCYQADYREKNPLENLAPICLGCDKVIEDTKNRRRKYHNSTCKERARARAARECRPKRLCPVCKKIDISDRRSDVLACSPECTAERRRRDGRTKTISRRALLNRYGLTEASFAERLLLQGNACASCKSSDPGSKGQWHIDHDHDCCNDANKKYCGKCTRGILCESCNRGIGHFHDDPRLLEAAAEYLRKYKKPRKTNAR